MEKAFFEFTLAHPIDGGKTTELMLHMPRNVHRPLTAKLDSMLFGGMMEFSKSANVNVTDTPSSEDADENALSAFTPLQIVGMLKVIPSKDYSFYESFCDTFKALMLSSNICKAKETDKGLTVGQYDSMSIEDGDKLLGEYIKRFFIISASS